MRTSKDGGVSMGVLDPITDLIRTVTKLARGGGEGHRDAQHEVPQAADVEEAAEAEEAAEVESHLELLSVILAGITTHYEYEKLDGLSRPEPFLVLWRKEMKEELERLEALRYAEVTCPGGIEQIERDHSGGQREFDLKQYARITDRGHQYLRLRRRYDRLGEPGS